MRFKRFRLEKFGHFTDRDIEFAKTPDLHIVFGPNEAGKTTFLNALRDVLFGIPARSPYNFLHEYKQMRLYAEVGNEEGQGLAFFRRKGNANTLLDADEAPLADSALDAFLGRIDRDTFENMFGLDQTGLRAGGRGLLEADGDAAGSIFGRAGGLRSVIDVRKNLEDEANALFTKHKAGSRRFYVALDKYNEQKSALSAATVNPDDWRKLDEAQAELAEERDAIGKQRTANAERRRRADRALRARPLVRSTLEVREALQQLGATATLSTDEVSFGRRALEDKRAAEQEVARFQDKLAAYKRQIDDYPVSEALLARNESIVSLAKLGTVVGAGRQHKPNLESQLKSKVAEEAACLRGLRSEPQHHEDPLALIPCNELLSRIRNLKGEGIIATKDLRRAEEDLRTAKERVAALGRDLAAMTDLADDEALADTVGAAARLGDIDERIGDTTTRHNRLRCALDDALAALPAWEGDGETLARLAVPLPTTVARFEADVTEANDAVRTLESECKRLHDACESHEHERRALLRDGEVPTREAIRDMRARRDRGWRLLREGYIESERAPDDDALRELFGTTAPAVGFEEAVRDADDLVDRRETESQRIARLEQIDSQHTSTQRDLASAQASLNEAVGRRDDLDQSWRDVWAPADLTPLSPREMSAWLDARQAALALRDELQEVSDQIDAMERSRGETRERLRQAIEVGGKPTAELPSGEALDPLLAVANKRLSELSDAKREKERCEGDLERARTQASEAENAALAARDTVAQWKIDWANAMDAIGQRRDARPQDIDSVLESLDSLKQINANKGELRRRIEGIERDEQALARELASLTEAVAADLHDLDCVAGIERLLHRLRTMEAAVEKRAELEEECKGLEDQVAHLERVTAEAERVLVEQRRATGSTDDRELESAWARVEKRQELQVQLQKLDEDLLEIGEGTEFEELRKLTEATSPDDDHRIIDEAENADRDINVPYEDIVRREQELEAQRREMTQGLNADQHAQAMQEALAELRDVTEEFALKTAGRWLLKRAVDRVRKSREGPILEQAGETFRELTLGSFEKLGIDYADNDRPLLVGVRAGGDLVQVDGMSEGTRDQLFLALRIALVMSYVESSSPLPFIADDLLVSFDDERAAAALRCLAELSERTQVILFTHHRHTLELVADELGPAGAAIHLLSGPRKPLAEQRAWAQRFFKDSPEVPSTDELLRKDREG